MMAQGKLKCTGSSAFLKRTFGTGYTVSLHFRGALGGGAPPAAASGNGFAPEEQGRLVQLVRGHVPAADVLPERAVGEAQHKLTFALPHDTAAAFPALFDALEAEKA